MKSINITNDFISVGLADGVNWSVRISEIVIIGEYTTEDGPGSDDYFICVVDRRGTRYLIGHEEGADEFLFRLRQLGLTLAPDLMFKTSFDSRILYPYNAKGLPLFRPPSKTMFGALIGVLKGQMFLEFSDDAKSIIEQGREFEFKALI